MSGWGGDGTGASKGGFDSWPQDAQAGGGGASSGGGGGNWGGGFENAKVADPTAQAPRSSFGAFGGNRRGYDSSLRGNESFFAGDSGFRRDDDPPSPAAQIPFRGGPGGRRQEFSFSQLPRAEVPQAEVKKCFYVEHPDVRALSEDQVVLLRKEQNDIKVEDLGTTKRPCPRPVRSFEEAFHNHPGILEAIAAQKFPSPTPIQAQLWPVVLSGEDAIGIAQTGTGKTLGFLLPAFVHIDSQPIPREERGGPSALILTPTRELAQQIREEVRKYKYKGIRSVCVYGGGSRRDQAQICAEGVDIVIATPGRLGDLVSDGTIVLPSITFLVLDEADRMLDMGFEPQIRDIIGEIREERHTVMTSATWPKGVQRMADKYLKSPMLVFIGSLSLTACHNVSQHVGLMREAEKLDELGNFLGHMVDGDKALIFVARKLKCDDIARQVRRHQVRCEVMHGDKDQSEREEALERFKRGLSPVLVATDVASRGLDVKDITHVLNYDFPTNMEEYVHRIGRSGRAGKLGLSVTFITKRDMHQATKLIKILEEASQEVPEGLRRWSAEFEANRPPPMDVAAVSKAALDGMDPGFKDPSGRRRERRPKEEPGGFYDPFTGERIGTLPGYARKD